MAHDATVEQAAKLTPAANGCQRGGTGHAIRAAVAAEQANRRHGYGVGRPEVERFHQSPAAAEIRPPPDDHLHPGQGPIRGQDQGQIDKDDGTSQAEGGREHKDSGQPTLSQEGAAPKSFFAEMPS